MKLFESSLLVPVLLLSVIFLFLLLVRLIHQLSPPANAAKAVMTAKGYLLLGRTKDAYEETRSAIDVDSENAEAHWLLGQLLMQRGELTDSADQIRQTLQLEPQNELFWRDLGLILLLLSIRQKAGVQLDECAAEEAILAFRQAYQIDPHNISNCLHIDMIEAATGLETCLSQEIQWHGWQESVHRFFRKQISETDCFDEIAKQPSRVPLAEAHFQVGLYYLVSSDLRAAKRNFRSSYWLGSDHCAASRVFLNELRT